MVSKLPRPRPKPQLRGREGLTPSAAVIAEMPPRTINAVLRARLQAMASAGTFGPAAGADLIAGFQHRFQFLRGQFKEAWHAQHVWYVADRMYIVMPMVHWVRNIWTITYLDHILHHIRNQGK